MISRYHSPSCPVISVICLLLASFRNVSYGISNLVDTLIFPFFLFFSFLSYGYQLDLVYIEKSVAKRIVLISLYFFLYCILLWPFICDVKGEMGDDVMNFLVYFLLIHHG